ncbi:MAG TPA: response regulator [bacterium]|nr:response regulator [bacterium]
MQSKKKRILLIEDSRSTRMTYKRIFEDAGFEVLEAETGGEGWDLTLGRHPDLVVLDLILPDMHGLEVLKNIRSHVKTRTIPVLVLTTIQEAEEVQRTLSFGASRYVHKGGITPEQIIEIAQDLLILKQES